MSFRDAEASDATLNGITTVLRAALEQPGYGRNPHQVYDNMDSDPLIGALPEPGRPVSRMELLRHVSNHRASPSAIPQEVVAFCRQHLQEGPESTNRGPGVLGRVQRLSSLADAIADPASGLSRRNAEALLRDLVADVVDPSAKLARQKFDLGGKPLSRYQMWCYPPADDREPFREIGPSRREAVNILGLGCFAYDDPTAELVQWVHALPRRVRAHLPTAWDAGASPGNVHWRPGGRAYQLEQDDYGVPEVVHDPIHGDDLMTPIEVLP
jgi:hypothetical protein